MSFRFLVGLGIASNGFWLVGLVFRWFLSGSRDGSGWFGHLGSPKVVSDLRMGGVDHTKKNARPQKRQS